MQELIQFAEKIKNEELRKKLIEFLKDPRLSHKDFKKYPREKIEKVKTPFTVAGQGTVERGDIIKHTLVVADLCVKTAEDLKKNYGIPINEDYLIAGALLHDIMKIFEWKVEGTETKHTGILLDHSMLATAELYHRGFPEEVIHIVASHFGEGSSTPPRNFEALILHHVDSLVSLIEFHLYAPKEQPVQVVLLDEESIKKLAGEKTEEKPK
jgi:7,8-dihydroneopterin 2',3'-cyclic phosphate phosphodiesterase